MAYEIAVALIGAGASVIAAAVASNQLQVSSLRGSAKIAFVAVLGLGLALTAMAFVTAVLAGKGPTRILAGDIIHNDSWRSKFVTLTCNSVSDQQVRLSIGETSTPDGMLLVALQSGATDLAASAVVPRGWYYRIESMRPVGCDFYEWDL